MTKTVKRIIAVVVLLVLVLLIGYSCFTSNRLASYPDGLDSYRNAVFRANDNTMYAFTGENIWYGEEGKDMVLAVIESYKEGVITIKVEEKRLQLVAIDENTLYNPSTEEFLKKRGDG